MARPHCIRLTVVGWFLVRVTPSPQRHRIRVMQSASRICLTYVVLFALAIPWYWVWLPDAIRLVLGMPLWACGALGGSALISCYTAWLLSFPWAAETTTENTKGSDE